MSSKSAPSVRSIARSLGLSHTTVSDALRGKGRVDPETAQRVQEAARAAGYRHNPLAGLLMSELRRSRGGTFRGVLAAVDSFEPDRSPHGKFHQQLTLGARERAAQLGFKLEEFEAGTPDLSVAKLDSVLQARGIHGLLLLPSWHPPDWSALDWTRYAGVYTDYMIERPALHCVTCNHFRSMLSLLALLTARGYKRPGLHMELGRDERTHGRFGAAFRSWQESEPGLEAVPPLVIEQHEKKSFCTWFRRHKPDVVIGHFTEAIDWMESCGAKIPEKHGFVSLNLLLCERPCAGLDQQPKGLGARAAELLIAQLQRRETGVPDEPMTITTVAKWIEGPTVRAATKGG